MMTISVYVYISLCGSRKLYIILCVYYYLLLCSFLRHRIDLQRSFASCYVHLDAPLKRRPCYGCNSFDWLSATLVGGTTLNCLVVEHTVQHHGGNARQSCSLHLDLLQDPHYKNNHLHEYLTDKFMFILTVPLRCCSTVTAAVTAAITATVTRSAFVTKGRIKCVWHHESTEFSCVAVVHYTVLCSVNLCTYIEK